LEQQILHIEKLFNTPGRLNRGNNNYSEDHSAGQTDEKDIKIYRDNYENK